MRLYQNARPPERQIWIQMCNKIKKNSIRLINLLAPELFFLILAHPVYKMWIIQTPNALELWNKLHFEEKKTENI